MKGWGTDDKVLVQIIGSHTYDQLQKLVEAYNINVKRDLMHDIHDETNHNFRVTLKALITEKATYDAECLQTALKGFGTNDEALIELTCTRSPDEIKAMFAAYKKINGKDAEKDISDDVSGDYGKLILAVCQNERKSTPDKTQMEKDVKALYEAGEAKLGTDEQVFIRILGSNPRAYCEELSKHMPKRMATRYLLSFKKKPVLILRKHSSLL